MMVLVTALLVAAVCAASAAASAMRANRPPCTPKALRAGLKRSSAQPKNARFERSFGCAGRWAYSGVVVGGKHGFDAIAVYRAEHGVWVAVNRAKPCRTHEIPAKIYRGACTTS
jgi:hypothetical protein